MRQNARPRRPEGGAVLLIVLLVVVLLLGLGMVGLYLAEVGSRVAANVNLSVEARMTAESGVERARGLLVRDGGSPISSVLAGSGGPLDDVPSSTSACDAARGAAYLRDVPFPSFDRAADLPPAAGLVPPRLGRFTVYVRQDQADCRSGNFTCEHAGDPGECSPPEGSPPPNGYVVIRAEAVARDGMTRAVVEASVYVRATTPSPTGGSTSTGGSSSGSGGSIGTGGGSGGSTGTGGGPGSGGTVGTGGGTTSVALPCLRYAVQAVNACPSGRPGCIAVNSGSRVDGYHSAAGSPGPGNEYPAGVAMTCSKSAASSSCPNNCPSGCVTGTISYGQPPAYSASTLPVPSHTLSTTHVVSPPAVTLRPAGAGPEYYEQVDLDAGGVITLEHGLYVVNRLNLNPGGTLQIDDSGGPVVLWVLSDLSPSSNVKVASGDPSRFWLVYDGTNDVNNNTNNDFVGVLFAPAAQVNLNYKIRGAVVGGKVTLNSLSAVHFDLDLACP
jgi:hypothetical protein